MRSQGATLGGNSLWSLCLPSHPALIPSHYEAKAASFYHLHCDVWLYHRPSKRAVYFVIAEVTTNTRGKRSLGNKWHVCGLLIQLDIIFPVMLCLLNTRCSSFQVYFIWLTLINQILAKWYCYVDPTFASAWVLFRVWWTEDEYPALGWVPHT